MYNGAGSLGIDGQDHLHNHQFSDRFITARIKKKISPSQLFLAGRGIAFQLKVIVGRRIGFHI